MTTKKKEDLKQLALTIAIIAMILVAETIRWHIDKGLVIL